MGKNLAGTNEFAFFAVEAYVPGGGPESGRKKIRKNAFWPVPVQKFTFPVLPISTPVKTQKNRAKKLKTLETPRYFLGLGYFARPLEESPRPFGPGIPEESPKESPGPSGPGVQKVSKQSRKSLRSLKKDCFETPETLPRLFRTLLGPRGRKARETLSETLRGFRARRAWETPLRGGRNIPILG